MSEEIPLHVQELVSQDTFLFVPSKEKDLQTSEEEKRKLTSKARMKENVWEKLLIHLLREEKFSHSVFVFTYFVAVKDELWACKPNQRKKSCHICDSYENFSQVLYLDMFAVGVSEGGGGKTPVWGLRQAEEKKSLMKNGNLQLKLPVWTRSSLQALICMNKQQFFQGEFLHVKSSLNLHKIHSIEMKAGGKVGGKWIFF